MSQYTRPKGVMGGPCLNCGLAQPDHAGLTCEQAKRIHDAERNAVLEQSVKNATLNTVKDHLTRMIASAEVYVDGEEIVTAYKIKTGALHKLIGFLGLTIPVNLPVVGDAQQHGAAHAKHE